MTTGKDIDIMVSGMSGKDFAQMVVKYLREVKGEHSKDIAIVSPNVEKSKHLETAMLKLFGQDIDFVSPRLEVYTSDSRIPNIKPATVEEDFLRRDSTINALSYNLQTGEVEDFTGKGIEDLKNGIIRTPIDSKKTFMDDPLRLLRSVRFSAKLGFTLDPAIAAAAKDPEVQEALSKKVSRERIEIELRKMLSGPNPKLAMELLKDFNLRSEIFQLPEGYSDWDMNQNNPNHELNVWGHLMEALSNLQTIIQNRNLNDSDKFVLNLAAVLHDVGKLDPYIKGIKETEGQLVNTYHGHEDASMRAAEYMLKKLPGITNKEIERVKRLIDAARKVNPEYRDSSEECDRNDKSLRKFVQAIQDDWENAIDLATADASAHKQNWISKFDRTYFDTMKNRIKSLGPEQIKNIKPLVSGQEIMDLFKKKGGPWMHKLISSLIDWQMGNPTATKEDAKQELFTIYDKLGLDKQSSISKREHIPRSISIRADIEKQFPAVCSCGRTYTEEEYRMLQFKGNTHKGPAEEDPGLQCFGKAEWYEYPGYDLLYRDCVCKSTMTRFVPCIHDIEDSAEDKDESNKYLKEKNDPKWDEILIDKDDIKLTRKDIRNYYIKNKDKILKEIKNKPIMLYIGTEKNKNILKRNHNDKPIVITNVDPEKSGSADNLIYWADRRVLSFHFIIGPKTKLAWVDLDLHGNFPISNAKQYAKELVNEIKKEFRVPASIWNSGGTGLHIQFDLNKEMDVDILREKLKVMLDRINENYENITVGKAKENGMRSDISTLHDKGNLRVPYSLGETFGKAKKPIGKISERD
jgi:tRNA nucleotidyltransferase (CCA-adding enzyme)